MAVAINSSSDGPRVVVIGELVRDATLFAASIVPAL
jgi:hypothetical protein